MGKREKAFCGVASIKVEVTDLKETLPGSPPSKERTKDIVSAKLYEKKKERKKKKKLGMSKSFPGQGIAGVTVPILFRHYLFPLSNHLFRSLTCYFFLSKVNMYMKYTSSHMLCLHVRYIFSLGQIDFTFMIGMQKKNYGYFSE